MTPTHTHKTQGGRFAMIAHYNGDTSLEAQMIVVYRDIDREIDTATTAKDWESNWTPIAADDCSICLGSGTDQIKGNKANPCGGCFGLGKVKEDGETPADRWELAEVAGGIIAPLRAEVKQLQRITRLPEVIELLQQRAQRQQDAQARQEREWRDGRGYGPGGARQTGD